MTDFAINLENKWIKSEQLRIEFADLSDTRRLGLSIPDICDFGHREWDPSIRRRQGEEQSQGSGEVVGFLFVESRLQKAPRNDENL